MESCLDCKYAGKQMRNPYDGRLDVFCIRYKQYVKPSVAVNCDYYSEIVDEPPTEKQIKWVDSLCDRLELDPPKFTKRDYSDFIDEWKDYVK